MDKKNIDNIVALLEERDASPDTIDEVVYMLTSIQKDSNAPMNNLGAFELYVRTRMEQEPDWRARAALAASLISKKLEEGY